MACLAADGGKLRGVGVDAGRARRAVRAGRGAGHDRAGPGNSAGGADRAARCPGIFRRRHLGAGGRDRDQ